MFDVVMTPAQVALRSAVRDFAEAEVRPIADEHDRLGTAPMTACQAFFDRGLAARFLTDDRDPSTPYVADACIAAEELAYACAATASLIMLPIFLNRLVLSYLPEEERGVYRDLVRSRPVVTAFAATEREAGSDLRMIAARAELVADGYVLNGRKEYSSNVRQSDFVVVVARTGAPDERSTEALTWFLVPTDTPGLVIGDRWETLGLRAMDLSPIELNEVCVPTGHLLGEHGRGLAMMAASLSQSRTGIAALAVGIARRARDEVLAFARQRTLYGDKLYKLQDYRFRIADMETGITAARSLVWLASLKMDQGLDATKEASIAKLFAGQMVMRVTEAASQMLGSIGYTSQSVVGKLFRDARHIGIVEGTEPTHKEIIFASVLRKGGS
ncbi:MAG: acyl-CoA dehydrogenase family protein [Candidatus Limnocylindrales bacterium]